jgi:hypothetical protein
MMPPACTDNTYEQRRDYSINGNPKQVLNVHDVTYQTARTDLLGLKDPGLLEMQKEGKKFVFKPAPDLTGKMEE